MEDFAGHRRDGGGGAERDLFERAFGQDAAALVVLREAPAGHQAKRERGNGQVRRVGFRIVAGLVSDQHPDATFADAPCQ